MLINSFSQPGNLQNEEGTASKMKQKLLKYPKLMLIGLLLVFAGCEKDPVLEEEEHAHAHGKNPNQVSMDFFKEMTQIEDVGLFLKEQMMATSALSRMSSYRFTDFTIDRDVVNQLELRNGEIAFSFKLYPNEGIAERGEMFNLVITRIEGSWQSSIFLLQQNPDTASEEFFTEIEEVYQSAGLPENFTFRTSARYRGNRIWHCTEAKGHCLGLNGACDLCNRCVTIIIERVTLPPPEDYDTPTLVDPTFAYNGGGGGSSNHNNTPQIVSDNCNDLKAKSANPNFNANISDLNTDAANSTVETAKVMYKNAPNYSPKSYGSVDSNGNSFIKLNPDPAPSSQIVGFMHSHQDQTLMNKNLAVFSITDFVAFGRLIENSTADVADYIAIVTGTNGTFALKLTNKQALIDLKNYIENPSTNTEAETNFKENVKTSMSIKNQIKGLLKFLNKTNSSGGIELYQRNSNNQWEFNYLDSNNKVKTSKCS